MPFYPLPLPGHDRKPESRARLRLNKQHPLSKGLVCDWVGGDTEFFNTVDPKHRITLTGAKLPKAATRGGLGTEFAPGTANGLDLGDAIWIDPAKPFSIAMQFRHTGFAVEGFPRLFCLRAVGGQSFAAFLSDNIAYDDISFGGTAFGAPNNWTRFASGPSTAAADTLLSLVLTFNGVDGLNAGNFGIFINGSSLLFNSASNFLDLPDENSLGIMGGANSLGGVITGFRVWKNRELDFRTAKDLSVRYWAPSGQPIAYRADCPRYFFVPAVGQGALVRTISEMLQGAESRLRALKLNRTEAASLGVSEATVGPKGLIRLLPETALFLEEAFGSRATIRQRGEFLQQSEAAQSVKGLVRLVVDALHLAESRDRVLGFVRSVSRSLQLSEVPRPVLGFVRSVLETLDLSEGRLRLIGLVRTVAEILQASEAIARARALARPVTATVQVDEASLPVRLLVRNRDAVLQAIETVFSSHALLRLRGETAELEETSPIARGVSKVLGETLSATEQALSSTVKGVVAVLCGSVSILAAVGGALFKRSASAGGVAIKASSGGRPDAPDCDEKPEN